MSTTEVNAISRRRVVTAGAWAAPIVAIAVAAPAAAASTISTRVMGTICRLDYGKGELQYQRHAVSLGLESSTGSVPAGSTFVWSVTMTGGANVVPVLEYSLSNAWTLTASQREGTVSASFYVTLTANENIATPWCGPRIVWTNIYRIQPGAKVHISSSSTGPDTEPVDVGLDYTVAKRHPSRVNDSGRQPHKFLSKSGAQTCYPAIHYTRLIGKDGYDNVTCYPDGVCSPPKGAAAVEEQYLQPAKC
ncbi:hypothetical protein [Arthrobacter sp. AOP36-C1-22]|uniref:hypothetical protein n=1 Tax=Arthrobacter sp. AOP36-C1-22 TaxID=3457683 RepID=UPI0040345AE3